MSALVSDRLLAGGPDDFLAARHLVLRGSQRDIGRTLADLAVSELGVRKAAWTDAGATQAQAAWLEEHWPGHAERASGVRDALGLAPSACDVDPTTLWVDWAVPGCSNVFWPPAATAEGHAVLTRNYDFSTGTVFELLGAPAPPGARPATSRPFVLETYPEGPNAGYATLTLSAYELLGGALDGVNEAGLGVALMATVEALRGGSAAPPTGRNGVGLNELQTVRFLLERAATAAEARALLAEVPTYVQFVPCHYLIADASGDAFLWSGVERGLVGEVDGASPLCATNHLPGRVLADIPQRAESVARLERLQRAASRAGVGGPVAPEAQEAVAREVAAVLPAGEGQYASLSPARTLWHGRYDLTDGRLDVDFYLGEGGAGTIRRSAARTVALRASARSRD